MGLEPRCRITFLSMLQSFVVGWCTALANKVTAYRKSGLKALNSPSKSLVITLIEGDHPH
eukprot:5532313-Amphidinium_carterae.2